jgi:hypothetical protein
MKQFQLERIHAMDLDFDMIRRAEKYLPAHQKPRLLS